MIKTGADLVRDEPCYTHDELIERIICVQS